MILKPSKPSTKYQSTNVFFISSVGRLILTKAPGIRDEFGDRDAEDVTHQYKNKEGTTAERLATFNAVRGVDK